MVAWRVRLLHTTDWHIGVTTRGVSRLADQAQALQQLLDIARDFRPHLVVHSGDVFHQPRPRVEDLDVAWDALRSLSELSPVVVLAGNHDSPQLFDLFDRMQPVGGKVTFVGEPRPERVLRFPGDPGETIRLSALPFVAAHQLVSSEQDVGARRLSYAARMMRLLKQCAECLRQGASSQRDLLIFAGHLFVEGARLSSSERALHVSDTYAVKPSSLPLVDYLALGHIHFPQSLPGCTVPGRYAGSLVALDFGEAEDCKEVVLVEARPGSRALVRSQPLDQARPLLVLEGTRRELEARAAEVGSCLLKLKVHVEASDPRLSDWARRLFPQADIVEMSEIRKTTAPGGRWQEADVENTLRGAFARYLQDIGGDPGLLSLLSHLEEGGSTCPALEQLAREVGLP